MTATSSFTGVGNGVEVLVDADQPFTFSVAGTFVGTVVLERFNGGGWTRIRTSSIVESGTLIADIDRTQGGDQQAQVRYRYRCDQFTSGTIVTTIVEIPKGNYMPTVTAVANVTAVVAYQLAYFQLGNMVIVSGVVDIQPTVSPTQVSVRFTLPVPTSFETVQQAGGTASNIGVSGEVFAFNSEIGASTVLLKGIPGHILLRAYSFTFCYQVAH